LGGTRLAIAGTCQIVEQISHAAQHHGFAILAYCFMPDHLHLLVEASSCASDLVAFAHALKQRTGYTHHRHHSAPNLWQKGYYEHVVRDDESTQTIAKYVLENPVRAGLAKEPLAYPFRIAGLHARTVDRSVAGRHALKGVPYDSYPVGGRSSDTG
jgi:REP element-mobilizing transposase RayT